MDIASRRFSFFRAKRETPGPPSLSSDVTIADCVGKFSIGGVKGMAEREWEGGELRIGDAIVELDSLRTCCPMTTVDPDTIARDPEVLKDIGRRFGGRLALNAEVGRGGVVRVGDAV